MTKNGTEKGQDRAWPGGVRWEFADATGHTSDIMWQCDAMRAGKLYSRSLFGSQAEAEDFALRMREIEPDQMFNVEKIKASTVWN